MRLTSQILFRGGTARFPVIHVVLAALCLTSPASSTPETPLWKARAALEDGLAPLAEKMAAELHAAPTTIEKDRSEALEILLSSVHAQGDAERLLAMLNSGSTHVDAHASPADAERIAFWRARALSDLGRPAEAAEILLEARASLPETLADRIAARIPPAMLAAGQTNAALQAYKEFGPPKPGTPGSIESVLSHARLLYDLSRREEAEQELEGLLTAPQWREDRQPLLEVVRLQLAQWLLARQDEAGAHALLDRLVGGPAPPDVQAMAHLRLSGIFERRNEPSAAAAAADQAIALARTPPVLFEVQSASARLFVRLGDHHRAMMALRQALRLQPAGAQSLRLQLDIANGLLILGRPADALPEYQTVIESTTDPGMEAEAQRGRAESLALTNRPAEAAVAFLRAVDLATDACERETSLYRAAEVLREAGLHAQAAETFSRFQALFPNSPRAARAAMLQGECLAIVSPAAAEEHLVALAERFPETPEAARALFQAAQLAAGRDDSAEATARYEQSLRHPHADMALRASCHVGRGLIFFNGFHFERALKEFEKAASFEGLAGEQASYLRAATLYNLGLEQESLDASLAFLRQRPESPWAPDVTYWLGRFYYNRRNFEESERHFHALVEAWPTRPECDGAWLWVARSRFALKRWAEASAAALQLIRHYPNSPLLAEARLVHAESLCERMRFDEAILAFDELLALHPESPWAPQALGRKGDSLFTLGTDNPARYKESISTYQTLLNRPGLALDMQLQGAYKIGRCHEKSGEVDAALEQYYRGVLLRYVEAREGGAWPNERAKAWFARAALSAADLMEQRQDWGAAASILQRMAREDVPGRADAAERARRILQAHPGASRP